MFFHGGWGKIAAVASAQYVIDRWSPELLVNLGTCGGFEGEITKGTIILVGGGEPYAGNLHVFVEGTAQVLKQLIDALPGWIAKLHQYQE